MTSYRDYPKPTNLLLKVHAMNDNFEWLNFESHEWLSHSSNKLIFDKVWHIAIAANCHLSFTNYPVRLLYN